MLNSRLTLLVLILSAIVLWLNIQHESQHDELSPSSLHTTNYSWQLFNTTTWQLDKSGNLSGSIVKTSTLFYDEAAKTSEFTQPKITLLEPDQTLFIESQTGQSLHNQIFQLRGQVVVNQVEHSIDQLNPPTHSSTQNKTLKTEYINYNSQTQKITSDQLVSITQPNADFSGTGLEIDLKNNHVQLLSGVKGELRPQKNTD